MTGKDDSKPRKKVCKKLEEPLHAEDIHCCVGAMHQQLGQPLSSIVQDSLDAVHVDISVLSALNGHQRYALRLQQHRHLTNLYEGHMFFSDQDVGGRVEMFMRLRSGAENPQYAPLKIGEWLVIRKDEQLPADF